MIRVNFTIPEGLYADFQARCKRSNTPMSTVIRQLMEHFIEKPYEEKLPATDMKIQAALNREATKARDKEILRRSKEEPYRLLAEEFGITVSGISRIVTRAGKRASV